MSAEACLIRPANPPGFDASRAAGALHREMATFEESEVDRKR